VPKYCFFPNYSKLLKNGTRKNGTFEITALLPHHSENPPLTSGCQKRQLKTHCLQTLQVLVEWVFTAVQIAHHSLTHICFTVLRIKYPFLIYSALLKKTLEITKNLQERHHPIPDDAVLSKVYCIIFLFVTTFRPALRPTQPPIQRVPGALSQVVKRSEREADHFTSCSDVMNGVVPALLHISSLRGDLLSKIYLVMRIYLYKILHLYLQFKLRQNTIYSTYNSFETFRCKKVLTGLLIASHQLHITDEREGTLYSATCDYFFNSPQFLRMDTKRIP
jgi:hypothetical protein